MPLAPTSLQTEASRRDGHLSPDPRSEAGKAASAQNATRHGLRGGGIVVRPEESAWYAALLAAHLELYAPCDEAERGLVEQLCIVELKLARLDRLELAALEGAADGEGGSTRALPALATLTRYRGRIAKERWELEHRLSQLRLRREARGAPVAGTQPERREAAQDSARGSVALIGTPRTAGLSADKASGTDDPEPAAGRGCTNEPEAEDARGPLNRRQRRLLARMARRAAVPARAAEAA